MSSDRLRSVDSSSSEYRTEYGRFTGPFLSERTSRTQNNLVVAYGENLYDAISVILICKTTNSVALSVLSEIKTYWFPTTPLKFGQANIEAVQEYLLSLLKFVKPITEKPLTRNTVFSDPAFVNCYRVQIPTLMEFVQRILYLVELKPEYTSASFILQESPITWFPIKSLASEQVWSNEVLHCDSNRFVAVYELTLTQIIEQFSGEDDISKFLMNVGVDERSLTRIYTDFIQLVYPAQTMNLTSFKLYMNAMKLLQANDQTLQGFFNAMCTSKHQCLTLKDLIVGLMVCDPKTAHGGLVGELRVDSIFKYYANNLDVLTPVNIQQFAFDLMKTRANENYTEDNIAVEVQSIYQAFRLLPTDNVSKQTFLSTIRNMGIRGTSALFRLKVQAFEVLKTSGIFPEIQLLQLNATKANTSMGVKMANAKGICFRCRDKHYTICLHYVKASQDGVIVEPQILMMGSVNKIPKSLRKMSLMMFDENNPLNMILEGIRESNETASFIQVFQTKHPKTDLFELLMRICKTAEDLFRSEQRVIKINSPCHVYGDIHGNLHDLLILEKIFWRGAPSCISSNYLFLGDYVDRGAYSVECILYLLCSKMLSPHRFIMLRGNHELRQVQIQFTFFNECIEKFGRNGQQVWEMFNKVFDVMPTCCVIDEQIYCAHGGIPTSITRLEQLQTTIPKVLKEPENECPSVWQMLWNDPISVADYNELATLLKNNVKPPPGYLPNIKRGTAFFFGEEAVTNFLNVNKLTNIIRAHEVSQPGFMTHCDGKVITVFSCSRYCNGFNDAACILVDDEKIRIIKFDTK